MLYSLDLIFNIFETINNKYTSCEFFNLDSAFDIFNIIKNKYTSCEFFNLDSIFNLFKIVNNKYTSYEFFNLDSVFNLFETINNKCTSCELFNLDFNLNSFISIPNIEFSNILVYIFPIIIEVINVLMVNSSNVPTSNEIVEASNTNYGDNNSGNNNDDDDDEKKKKKRKRYVPEYNSALRKYSDPYQKIFVEKGQYYFRKSGATPLGTTADVLDQNKFLDLKESFLKEVQKNPDKGLTWEKATDLYMCSWDQKWFGTSFNKGNYEEVTTQLDKYKFSTHYTKATDWCTRDQYETYRKMFDYVDSKQLGRIEDVENLERIKRLKR